MALPALRALVEFTHGHKARGVRALLQFILEPSARRKGWNSAVADIHLTNGMMAYVDDQDVTVISGYRWSLLQSGKCRYAIANSVTADGRHTTIRMHRLLMPGVAIVDHRDGDGLNNRRSNLRPATHTQNLQNSSKRIDGVSRHKGVGPWLHGKWRARITVNGRNKTLGIFNSEAEAAAAYGRAADLQFGEFARKTG